MIEHGHLKIIQALDANGTLTKAAVALHLTQSALSHQIRHLEKNLGVLLWQREGRRLRLTQAGNLLLRTAERLLPILSHAEKTLLAYGQGRKGILRIGVECYPCRGWLNGVIGDFMRQLPDVDVEVASNIQFSGLEALQNHHIDILITPDPGEGDNIHYESVSEYELVLLVSAEHRLANRKSVAPEHFASESLLTFPVPLERLDIFTQFLTPANISPANHKSIESIDLMVQMVEMGRGLCVLPAWLAEIYCRKWQVKSVRLGESGLHKNRMLGVRTTDKDIFYVKRFVAIGRVASKSLSSYLRDPDENQ